MALARVLILSTMREPYGCAYPDSGKLSTLGQTPILAGDLNYRLPDGRLNPFFLGNGYYYAQQNFLRLKRGNDTETLRASLSYEHDLGKFWGQHRFAVMKEPKRTKRARWPVERTRP